MKILRIIASGLPLFTGDVTIDFLAQQRVTTEGADKLCHIFGNYYQNNVVSIVGINASGKTSLLKVITFALRMLNNEPINTIGCREILGNLSFDDKVVFDIYFYAADNTVRHLHTVIGEKKGRYYIEKEQLESKAASKVKTKKSLFDFDKADRVLIRDEEEEFLLDDVSIMVAFNKRSKEHLCLIDMLQYTNVNQLNIGEQFPAELIAFFDPCVEYLRIKKRGKASDVIRSKDSDIRLKFKGKEEILLTQPAELNRYLSSGTIKGINTFVNAMQTFEAGGYLIVDELENHFNKEIVSTLIRFYMDQRVNPKGAVLLFSTHYAELLDEFERNDNIYIVRNRSGITAENLSTVLKRNDIKKSEAYQSGFLEGTVPAYEAYMDLKKVLLMRQQDKQRGSASVIDDLPTEG